MPVKKSAKPTVRVTLRDCDAGTIQIIDRVAKATGISRNAYINMLLDRFARDSAFNPHNRDSAVLILAKIVPLLERNTAALEKFERWFAELKEIMDDGGELS